MSRRGLHRLIALHPRRWRRRYGDELGDLVAELERHGDQSTVRLALSLLVSVIREWARIPGRRPRRLAGASLAAVVLAVALITPGSTQHALPTASRSAQHHAPSISASPATSCFVGSASCGGPTCQEFVQQQPTSVVRPRTRTVVRSSQCVADPTVRPHTVWVTTPLT